MQNLRIFLYTEPRTPRLRLDEVAFYLENKCRAFSTEVRDEFFAHWLSCHAPAFMEHMADSISYRMARAKIRNPSGRNPINEPLMGEVEFERRKLMDEGVRAYGDMYDAPKVLAVCGELIDESERGADFAHVALTNQLLAAWDPDERRYRVRTLVCGGMSLISTTGIVEGPAELSDGKASGVEDCGPPLSHDDGRITEVVKGYALQAVVHHLTGKPFCDDANCRLFNARRKDEVLRAQICGVYDLCSRHEAFLHAFERAGAEA